MYRALIVFCTVWMMACHDKIATVNHIAIENGVIVSIDSAGWPQHFGWGHPATKAGIAAIDKDIMPNGRGLPRGNGNAIRGSLIYAAKCAVCHGSPNTAAGIKLPGPPLFANPDSPQIKTIGNYWPYATTIFDYVRRSMPYNATGSLTDNEVYALTAYLLHANQLVDSARVINAASLPRIIMPAQKRFVADDRRGGPEIK